MSFTGAKALKGELMTMLKATTLVIAATAAFASTQASADDTRSTDITPTACAGLPNHATVRAALKAIRTIAPVKKNFDKKS